MNDNEILETEKEGLNFGRNQIISIFGGAIPILMTYVLIWFGKTSGTEWIAFLHNFIPWWLGITLGFSSIVKSVEAYKGKQ